MMIKSEYESLDLEIIAFEGQDVITISCTPIELEENELIPVSTK